MQTQDDGEQLLHLKWNNHTNNLMDIIREQFSKQSLVDVTLSCQGKRFRAHRMILSACSPYFQEIFDDHDTPHPIIILNNMNHLHIKSLLEFMYKGEIKVIESDLECFLQTAEVLQVKGLCNIRNKDTKRLPTEDDESEPRPKQKKLNEEGTSQILECEDVMDASSNEDSANESSSPSFSKKRSRVPPIVKVQVGAFSADRNDNDLASFIKVEPPDIMDIDGTSADDKDGPKVLIDLPIVSDEKTTITTTTIRTPKKERRQRKDKDVADEANKIRRPPNAFMIFANEWRRRLALENPKESNKAISIRLGVMWKGMDPPNKECYYNAAKQADLEHKQKYPGYYYSPKEAREALLRKKLTKKKMCFEATQLVRVLMPVGDDEQGELEEVPYS